MNLFKKKNTAEEIKESKAIVYGKKMEFSEVFGCAKWIMADDSETFPVIRKNFEISGDIKRATIDIVGFGAFVFYVNGTLGTDDLFLPLNSDFEEREFPIGEVLEHRVYVSNYDITCLLKKGKNTLSVLLGNGWYNGNYSDKKYGDMKVCYKITVETDKGVESFVSDLSDKFSPSYITKSIFYLGEEQDYSCWDEKFLSNDFDDTLWENVKEAKAVESDFYYSDCPTDRVISSVEPKIVSENGDTVIYDTGVNFSGYPVIETLDGSDTVKITFSEELDGDDLDKKHMHSQFFTVKTGGKKVIAYPRFTWLAFRYFKVEGKAKVLRVHETHTNAPVTSEFESSNETLNWIYKTYINTQLNNMHGGIPSDCPHLERRGYTGDGEITCRSVMRCLDAEKFYNKWIDDISDCQDKLTGHVQYTAPYTASGGGPGGWGAAIVILPYEFWKYYGDDSKIKAMYPKMLKYFEYLEAHSENNLVTTDKPGAWCLGEWCTPGPVILPAPFVNNYFYVKALEMTIEIAEYLGKKEDIPMMEERIKIRKDAITAAYLNPWDGNFLGMVQGANAFALDIGLGDERTKENFIKYYDELGYYDTGIFGIDVVTRLLFKYGRGDVAFKLLTADEPSGFGWWKKDGATSFREYWGESRSHSHPMFGSVVAYFFEYILGIKYFVTKGGTPTCKIEAVEIPGLDWAKGAVMTPFGKIIVSRKNENGKLKVECTFPGGIKYNND